MRYLHFAVLGLGLAIAVPAATRGVPDSHVTAKYIAQSCTGARRFVDPDFKRVHALFASASGKPREEAFQ